MKKSIGLLLLGVVLSCGRKENINHDLTITGDIFGLKQGVMYIKTAEQNDLKILDSVVFNGKSTYKVDLNIEEPKVLYLTLDRGVSTSEDNAALVFAEPGKMIVNSSLDNFYHGMNVEGSASHDLLQKYLDIKKSLANRQNDLIREQINADRTFQTQKADSIQKVLANVQRRIYLNALNFALKNKDSNVAPYIALTDIAAVRQTHLDSIYNNLTPTSKEGFYGKILGQYLNTK